MSPSLPWSLCCCLVLASTASAATAAVGDLAEGVVADFGPAVGLLEIRRTTVWQRGGDERRHEQVRVHPATVIGADGLTVAATGGGLVPGARRWRTGNGVQVQVQTGVQPGRGGGDRDRETVVVLRQGDRELPMRQLGHDRDSGLTFYRPAEEPAEPLDHLVLPAVVADLALLDEVLVLGRLDEQHGAAPLLVRGRVGAVVPGDEPVVHLDVNDPARVDAGVVCSASGELLGLLVSDAGGRPWQRHGSTWLAGRSAIKAARSRAEAWQARWQQRAEQAAEADEQGQEEQQSDPPRPPADPAAGF